MKHKIGSKEQLRDEADKVWSLIIRTKFQYTCTMCGAKDRLVAHHAFKTKGSSSALRHDISNGICLCVFCHGKVHDMYHKHDVSFYTDYFQKLKQLIPEKERQDMLDFHNSGQFKFTKDKMEVTLKDLQDKLDSLTKEPNCDKGDTVLKV